MENDSRVRALTKPGFAELTEAIHCLTNGHDQPFERLLEAGLTVTGEACSLLELGKTKPEIIASLAERGMPADFSISFVDKAYDIFQSSSDTSGDPRSQSTQVSGWCAFQ